MTTHGLYAVGFCAHYSQPGDWAFEYALKLSQSKNLQLNVFHFLADPYDSADDTGKDLAADERTRMAIERERELRLYYDKRAGDYLDIGFRLCEDNEWTELHRCLLVREFQVLVLAYPKPAAIFAGKPIEEFANSFVSPVVLVGPDGPSQYRLNSRAVMIVHELGLADQKWEQIVTVKA